MFSPQHSTGEEFFCNQCIFARTAAHRSIPSPDLFSTDFWLRDGPSQWQSGYRLAVNKRRDFTLPERSNSCCWPRKQLNEKDWNLLLKSHLYSVNVSEQVGALAGLMDHYRTLHGSSRSNTKSDRSVSVPPPYQSVSGQKKASFFVKSVKLPIATTQKHFLHVSCQARFGFLFVSPFTPARRKG